MGWLYLVVTRQADVPYSVFINEFVLKRNVNKIVIYDNCMVRFFVNSGLHLSLDLIDRSLPFVLREIRSRSAIHVLCRRHPDLHHRFRADPIRNGRASQSVHQCRVRRIEGQRVQHLRSVVSFLYHLPREHDDPSRTGRRHGNDVSRHGSRD